jgi:hypothetical protein
MTEDKSNLSDEARRRELEAEMERHKERFMAAGRRGLDAIRGDLTLLNWVREYPIETAALAFLGGIFIGLAKPLDRSKRSSLG